MEVEYLHYMRFLMCNSHIPEFDIVSIWYESLATTSETLCTKKFGFCMTLYRKITPGFLIVKKQNV